MSEFKKFLNQFRCEKGQPSTHTTMGKGAGAYNIPRTRMPEFFQQYTREMVRPGALLHLTEKPTDPSPMRADLDFRFALPTDGIVRRTYTQEDVARIVGRYSSVLAEYVSATDEAPIVGYVMEKPDAVDYRGKVKDGIHIVWPNQVISHNVQHLIRKRVLDTANELFLGMNICNDYGDVLDKAIIDKNNWQMYGSSKPDSEAYRVTSVYQWVGGPISGPPSPASELLRAGSGPSTSSDAPAPAPIVPPERPTSPTIAAMIAKAVTLLQRLMPPTATEELSCPEMFSMRHKDDFTSILRPEKVAEVNEYIRHVLPNTDEKRMSKLKTQIFGKSVNYVRTFAAEEELALARVLVKETLSARRAENYEDWIKCGWALRNIDYRLLETWVEFSSVSSKYVEGQCQQLWDNMRADTLGMGTLRWWAKQDNPIRFNEIMDRDVYTLIDRCIGTDGAHFDVAKVIYTMFKDHYRFMMNDTWYTYDDNKHRWVRNKEGLKLRMVLSNDVCRKFSERSMYWTQESVKTNELRESYEEKSKKLMQISVKLKTSGYKDSVMKECKCMFTDEHFDELLDSHPHLIGFENGVYDLRMHEFRDGLPDDYISFSTGRYYAPYNPLSEDALDLTAYLSQVFTNENVRKYMMDLLAVIIDGSIRQEKFYVFTGSGCHAIDTEILMYDGTKRLVQDVVAGDLLMGDDSTPRTVSKLFRGTDVMYEIQPIKGEPFVVNQDHVLSLKVTAPIPAGLFPRAGPNGLLPGDVLDIKVCELLATVPPECYTPSVAAACLALYQPARAGAIVIASPMRVPFKIVPMPAGSDDRYFGFELDGNHRYLTGDFVVHHNSNSKSVLLQLVQKAVGEYYCILPIALLTQKRTASNAAQSELERTKGRRVAVMQEPGESEKLNIGLMKELSGGDIIQCRGLFKEPVEFRPQFKMIMTCNELPEVPSDDGGTWRRIRVIEFTSKFTDAPDPNNPKEFPVDPELTGKLDRWADMFISMTLDHHSKMDVKGLVEPMEVRIATESYKKNNDVIGQFVADSLRLVPDSPDRLQLQKAYTYFKVWAFSVIPKGKKVPDRNQFKAYMEKTYGVYNSKGWLGLRYVSPDADDEEEEEEEADGNVVVAPEAIANLRTPGAAKRAAAKKAAAAGAAVAATPPAAKPPVPVPPPSQNARPSQVPPLEPPEAPPVPEPAAAAPPVKRNRVAATAKK